MTDTLVETLKTGRQAGRDRPPRRREHLLVLPHGGRILGLFPGNSGENFFWTPPRPGCRRFGPGLLHASDQWQNSGGDRTWLTPEVDIFLPDYPRTDRYWQPRSSTRATTT